MALGRLLQPGLSLPFSLSHLNQSPPVPFPWETTSTQAPLCRDPAAASRTQLSGSLITLLLIKRSCYRAVVGAGCSESKKKQTRGSL